MPALIAEYGFVPEVMGLVAFDLRLPKGAAGFWYAEGGTVFIAVPEAAVDEEGLIDDC